MLINQIEISMRQLFFVILSSVGFLMHAQSHHYYYQDPADSNGLGYLKVLPEGKPIGLVVRDFSKLPDMDKPSPYKFQSMLLEAGYICLYTRSSTDFPELYIKDEPMEILELMITAVASEHAIPDSAIFMGGISASGTRALRFAEFCKRTKSKIQLRGLFIVDSPLDLVRFYKSAKGHAPSFKKGMAEEAAFMVPKFESWFGAAPNTVLEAYQEASVFSHSKPYKASLNHFINLDIIIYHEPDINWWLEERGASYYDINSFDLVAFTQSMRQLGNSRIKMVSTSGKGFDRAGNRKCHSWTIVDERMLCDWILERS